MSNSTFVTQVDDFIRKSQLLLTAVCRQSVQDVIEQAQLPTAKGGRMRVDTGFLRASGRISFSGMPSGPTRGDGTPVPDTTQSTILQIGQWKVDQVPLFFGWTANYAKYREAYDGFLSAAAQNWQQIVAANVQKLKDSL